MRHSARKVILMLVIIIALPVTPLTPIQKAQDIQENVSFEILLAGGSTSLRENYEESLLQVITTRKQWKKAWRKLFANLNIPENPLPEVDFSQRMVILLYYHYLPDPSFSLSITDLIEHDDYLEVAVKETQRQGPGCLPVPAVVIMPFQIIETDILKKRYRNNLQITAQREVVDCLSQNE